MKHRLKQYCNKIRFKTIEEAQVFADQYNSDIMVYTLVQPYYCKKDKCYHVGHSRVRVTYNLQKYPTHDIFESSINKERSNVQYHTYGYPYDNR